MLQNKNIKRRTCSHIADVLAEVRFIFCSVFSRSSIWSLGFFVSFPEWFFFFFQARKWDEILCDCFLSVEMNKLWKCILVTSIKRWHVTFFLSFFFLSSPRRSNLFKFEIIKFSASIFFWLTLFVIPKILKISFFNTSNMLKSVWDFRLSGVCTCSSSRT